MLTSVRAALVGATLLCALGCGHSMPKTPLERLAGRGENPNLDRIYRERGVPLLLIGDSLYVPPCACLDQPCTPRFGGVAETRDLGQKAEARQAGGVAEARQSGGATERRETGETTDARVSGGVSEGRVSGGSTEGRMSGAANEDRLSGGSNEDRMSGAANEERMSGGATSQITCRHVGNGRFKVFSPTPQPIRVFDESGMHVLPENNVVRMY